MERLTSSPRIANMYGHCGTTVLTEYLPYEVETAMKPNYEDEKTYNELVNQTHTNSTTTTTSNSTNQQTPLYPKNNIPIHDKLDFALTMAETLADLHGFKDGVIVHDDIQPAQYLWNPEGYMKLNNFNRAEVMLYDETYGQYCKYKNGWGGGDYRAPEEYKDAPLDEKIDVFSMGNCMHTLLTGSWTFPGLEPKELRKKVIGGALPYVDPRYKTHSYEEGVLVDLMMKCWEYDPDKRIDIFGVVKALEEAIENKNKKREEEKK